VWGVDAAVAHRRLWALQWQGLVEAADADPLRWRVAPVVRLALGGDAPQWEMGGSERQ
jgi:hypothetical protein